MKHEKKHLFVFFTCPKGKSVKNTKRFMVKQKPTRNPDEDTENELVITPCEKKMNLLELD